MNTLRKLKSFNLVILTFLIFLLLSLVFLKTTAKAEVRDINYYKAQVSKKTYLEKLNTLKEKNLIFKPSESIDKYSQTSKLNPDQKAKSKEIENKMFQLLATEGLSDSGAIELDLDGMEIVDHDNNLTKIVYSFLNKPEYFWLTGSINKQVYTTTQKVKTLRLESYFSSQVSFKKALDEFLAYSEYSTWQEAYQDQNKDGVITRAEIAKNLHDSILKRKPYNKAAAENLGSAEFSFKIAHSSFSVFSRENLPVCDGYAKAYAYVLNKLGIPTLVAGGNANGPHAWNYVYLNQNWYFTDLTWDQNLNGGEIFQKHLLKTQPASHQNYEDSFVSDSIVFEPKKPKLTDFDFGGLKQEDESSLTNDALPQFEQGEFTEGLNPEQANQLIELVLKHLNILGEKPLYLNWRLSKAGVVKKQIEGYGEYLLEIAAATETKIAKKTIQIKTTYQGTTLVKVNTPSGQTELSADLGSRLNFYPNKTYQDKTFVGFDKDISKVSKDLKEVEAKYEKNRSLINFLVKSRDGSLLYSGQMLKGQSVLDAIKNNFLKPFFPHLALGSKFSHLELNGQIFNTRTPLSKDTEVTAVYRHQEPKTTQKEITVAQVLKHSEFVKTIGETKLTNPNALFDLPDLTKYGWELDLINSDIIQVANKFKLKDPFLPAPKIYYKPILGRLKEITINTTQHTTSFKKPGRFKFKYIANLPFNSKYQLFDLNNLNQDCKPGYSLIEWQIKGLGEGFDVSQSKYTDDLELIPKVIKAKVELLYKEGDKTIDFNKEGIANAAQIAKLIPPVGKDTLFVGWLAEDKHFIYTGYNVDRDIKAYAQVISKKELIAKLNWEVFKNGKFILNSSELKNQDFSKTIGLIKKRFPTVDIKKITLNGQKVNLTLGSNYSMHTVDWEFDFVKDPIIYWDFFKDPLKFFKKFSKQAAIIGGLTLALAAFSLIILISVIKVFKRSVKNKD